MESDKEVTKLLESLVEFFFKASAIFVSRSGAVGAEHWTLECQGESLERLDEMIRNHHLQSRHASLCEDLLEGR